jgi:hypothetical protein
LVAIARVPIVSTIRDIARRVPELAPLRTPVLVGERMHPGDTERRVCYFKGCLRLFDYFMSLSRAGRRRQVRFIPLADRGSDGTLIRWAEGQEMRVSRFSATFQQYLSLAGNSPPRRESPVTRPGSLACS